MRSLTNPTGIRCERWKQTVQCSYKPCIHSEDNIKLNRMFLILVFFHLSEECKPVRSPKLTSTHLGLFTSIRNGKDARRGRERVGTSLTCSKLVSEFKSNYCFKNGITEGLKKINVDSNFGKT